MTVDLASDVAGPRGAAFPIRSLYVTLQVESTDVALAAVALGPFGALSSRHVVDHGNALSPDHALELVAASASTPSPGLRIELERFDDAAWAVAVVVSAPSGSALSAADAAITIVDTDTDGILGSVRIPGDGPARSAVVTVASRDFDSWQYGGDAPSYAADFPRALASLGATIDETGDTV